MVTRQRGPRGRLNLSKYWLGSESMVGGVRELAEPWSSATTTSLAGKTDTGIRKAIIKQDEVVHTSIPEDGLS